MKHNYPKYRKKRNTEYSKTYKLLQELGEDRFWELSKLYGQYKLAELLSRELSQEVSPYVICYIRKRGRIERRESNNKAIQ